MLVDKASRSQYSTRSSKPMMTTSKNTRAMAAMAKPFPKQASCPNPKLQVDHGRKSQTDHLTTKFTSDDAILHEIAWRSQWWVSQLLLGQQCHTFQIFPCRTALYCGWRTQKVYSHTPFRRPQYQYHKQVFWTQNFANARAQSLQNKQL